MTSSSDLGSTDIVIQFNVDRKIDAAAQDVQAAISQAMVYLPVGIIPPSFHRSNPAAAPVMFMALTSKIEPLSVLDEVAETTIAQRLSMVDGVAEVGVWGQQKYAVRIALNPEALASRGIGVDQVTNAVNEQNVNLPTGVMWGAHQTITVQATGNLYNAREFGDIVVAYHNGAPVRLRDIASVTDDVQNNRTAAWFNDERSVGLYVLRQPGTNTVAVTRAVHVLLDEIKGEIPPDVTLRVTYDRAVSIGRGVHDVKFAFGVALVLVVLVIFFFLRNVSATIIPSLALPMSVIGTFSVMYLFHYSIDNLSLMALTLAVGFVVDDAIVVLENIVRHMEMGKPRMQAALDGAAEVGSTIVTMTTSLSAVFIPIMFMGGLIGMLFHEFGVTIAVAILVSGCVSLTLTPMLCSRFLSPVHTQKHGRLYNWSEAGFNSALHAYERSLVWVMRHRPVMLGLSALTLVIMVVLFITTPKGLFPSDDTGQLMATTEGAEGISFSAILPLQQRIDSILLKDPNIQSIMPSVGSQGSANQGRVYMVLKPLGSGPSDRHLTADSVVSELMPKLNTVPGIAVFVQNPPSIRVGGRGSKSFYQYTLLAPDLHEVENVAEQLQKRLEARHEFEGVTSDLQIKNPEVHVLIDRDEASKFGITANQIEQTLYDAYGSSQVSTIYTPTNEYWVVMESMPQYERDENSLKQLYIYSPRTKQIVPLTSIARLQRGVGPLEIDHSGQLPSVTISFNVVLGRGVEPGRRASREDGSPNRAVPHHRRVRRTGAGVSGLAARSGRPAPALGVRDLCGARDPVRELHPPDHHSVGYSLRGRRRAHRAARHAPQPRCLRLCRHDHADRDREEERHHDDRLRDRDRTRRAQGGGGSDRRGGEHPLPADHDDDGRRHHGQPPARDRSGRHRGVPTRHWHRRRRRARHSRRLSRST